MANEPPEEGMGPLGQLTRWSTPWGFPVVYLGWAYAWWYPILASGESVWSSPNSLLFVIGALSPILAGIGLLWLTAGRAGLDDLWIRLVDRHRLGIRWMLLIVAFYPAFGLLMGGLAMLIGLTDAPLDLIGPDGLLDPAGMSLIVAVAIVFPIVEEVGLRGYWFDQLQLRWSALTSSLLLGMVWAAWHVPLVYLPGYFGETTFAPELWWWLPNITLMAIIASWIYNNTDRSVIAVIGLHAFGNLAGELMGFSPEMYPFVVGGTLALAAGLVVAFGPDSLRGWDRPRPRNLALAGETVRSPM